MWTSTTQLFIPLGLALSFFAGCGSGETHFVNDKPAARIPEQDQRPTRTVTENFTYARSVGTPVVAFVLHPRKSMGPARANLVEQLPAYLDALFSGGESYRGIHFVVMRDIGGAEPEWYSPDQSGLPASAWKAESLVFLQSTLSRLAIERKESELDALSPYQSFDRIAGEIPYHLGHEPGPVWLALNYFRDGDWLVAPLDEEAVRGSLRALSHSLALQPVSPFRTSLELIAYLSGGGECDPLPNRIARSLQAWFETAGLNLGREELCPWFSPNPAVTRAAMARVGESLHRQDRRLILQSVPKLESIRVTIENIPVARENVIYLAATNEIAIRQDTQPAPVSGDIIEIRYESKER